MNQITFNSFHLVNGAPLNIDNPKHRCYNAAIKK